MQFYDVSYDFPCITMELRALTSWLRRECAMWIPTAFPLACGSSSSPSKKTTSPSSYAVVDTATLFLWFSYARSCVRYLAGLGVLAIVTALMNWHGLLESEFCGYSPQRLVWTGILCRMPCCSCCTFKATQTVATQVFLKERLRRCWHHHRLHAVLFVLPCRELTYNAAVSLRSTAQERFAHGALV